MTDKLYIDGVDVYAKYKVLLTKGWYVDAVTFAPLKGTDSNTWAEEDGTEFDLTSPVLDTRELTLNFACLGVGALFGEFIELLSGGAYHEFDFTAIGRTLRLRLTNNPALQVRSGLEMFTLCMADDFPLDGYAYSSPASGLVSVQGYELDGRDVSAYGMWALSGNIAEIQKSPAVKKNLLRSLKSGAGAFYDDVWVNFQTKDVRLSFLMRADTLTEFWRNYDALLYDLTRPGERVLYVDATGYEYPCFYRSGKVDKFATHEGVWLEFSIVLTFTSFRVDAEEFLLASEREELIITEGDDKFVDLGE
jgi:hypothetical protein